MNVPRAGLALASGCTAAVLAYALLRVLQAALTREPNPALVMWSEHSGFFWRSWTAAYFGGTVTFAAWIAAGRDPARLARVLARAVVAVAAVAALQGLLVP